MAGPSHDDYLRHLRSESTRFREVLAGCDPAARVPGCPDWDAADLLWHLGEVQHFWRAILAQRPAGPEDLGGSDRPTRPTSYDGLLTYLDEGAAALADALAAADPAEQAWTWAQDHTVGFIHRRQAHEALIHRLDAEQAAGTVTPLDPALASDGVEEALDVMFGGCPPWGEFTPLPHHVRVDCRDTDQQVWVQLGRFTGTSPDGVRHDAGDIHVVPGPGTEPDVVVEGPAGDLDAWLWRRGDDARLSVTGDRDVYRRFREAVDQPID